MSGEKADNEQLIEFPNVRMWSKLIKFRIAYGTRIDVKNRIASMKRNEWQRFALSLQMFTHVHRPTNELQVRPQKKIISCSGWWWKIKKIKNVTHSPIALNNQTNFPVQSD